MKLQPNHIQQFSVQKYIAEYNQAVITINNQQYQPSLYVFNHIHKIDDINDISQIKQLNFDIWLGLNQTMPEVIILGTGDKQKFLVANLYTYLHNKNIGIECMTNHAACRTYNVLLQEERKVALVLI